MYGGDYMNETYSADYQYQPTRIDLSRYKMSNKPRDQWTDEEIEAHDLWCRLMADEIRYRQFTGAGFSLFPPVYALHGSYPITCWPMVEII